MNWIRHRPYTTLSAVMFLATACFLLLRIHSGTPGHFTYALDDPYIHLALARNIAHGHYGLNVGEPSSPSSSLLWPFLLAPLANTPVGEYVPLLLNLLFGLCTALLLGHLVDRWPTGDQPRMEPFHRTLALIFLLLFGNVVGLVFLGMEHSLQGLLAVALAFGCIECMHRRMPPWWVVAAAILMPAIRYDSATLTLAFAIALVGIRQYRRAAAVIVLSAVLPVGFALFFHHHRLPLLPMSVMVKSGTTGAAGMFSIVALIRLKMSLLLSWVPVRSMAMFALLLGGIAVAAPDRERRFVFAGASLACTLHLFLGPFSWFYRYEVATLMFAAAILFESLFQRPRMLFGVFFFAFFLGAYEYVAPLRQTPAACHEVYAQQYQTSRFLTEFTHENIAVGDLGEVAFRKAPSQYVLDFIGLGSPEISAPKWRHVYGQDNQVHEHNIALVAIYYELLPSIFPADWQSLGTVCLPGQPVAVWKPCVHYYVTDPAKAQALHDAFVRFSQTVPTGDKVTIDPLP